jgi:hypothetical protein
MVRIRQRFNTPRVPDVAAEVHQQLQRLALHSQVRPGASVAITVGSRGIARIATIIRAVVDHFRGLGAVPFLVPAMGSHGGGTAEGQRQVLASYGITEQTMGAEIRSSMETVIVAITPQGIPVHFDKYALQAEHVVVVGRVKPHTGFVGEIESGLHKMMLIGLGKHEGAKIYHRAIKNYSFLEIIRAVADVVLSRCRIVAGLAIVENADDDTGLIEAVPPPLFFERERELLRLARQWLPRLPVPDIHLLIVDRIGKDISGTGMDTNVIGRKFNEHAATERDEVRCRRILVRSLTEKTHGNATGIGIAEFTTRRAAEQMDRGVTQTNCITGGHPEVGMLPLVFESDREAIEAALQTAGLIEPPEARVVQIADTLHLTEMLVSEACLPLLADRPHVEVLGAPQDMPFDESGNLPDV